jgi:hypothetical protein
LHVSSGHGYFNSGTGHSRGVGECHQIVAVEGASESRSIIEVGDALPARVTLGRRNMEAIKMAIK